MKCATFNMTKALTRNKTLTRRFRRALCLKVGLVRLGMVLPSLDFERSFRTQYGSSRVCALGCDGDTCSAVNVTALVASRVVILSTGRRPGPRVQRLGTSFVPGYRAKMYEQTVLYLTGTGTYPNFRRYSGVSASIWSTVPDSTNCLLYTSPSPRD